jgi:hypothetical protein
MSRSLSFQPELRACLVFLNTPLCLLDARRWLFMPIGMNRQMKISKRTTYLVLDGFVREVKVTPAASITSC